MAANQDGTGEVHDAGRAGIQSNVNIETISGKCGNVPELIENLFGMWVTYKLEIFVCEKTVSLVKYQTLKTVR